MSYRAAGAVSAIAFVLTVYAANWAITEFGPVSVGFGLMAPAGVFFAGLAFLLRDVTHRTLGRPAVAAAIAAGALLSWLLADGRLAVASAVAFLVSEVADWAVYEPMHRRSPIGGVVASNVVGSVVDSLLFLSIAFGSLAFLEGQIVGKLWVTAAAIPVLVGARVLVGRAVPERG